MLNELLGTEPEREIDTLENAQRRAEYWKAEHLAANAEIERLRTLLADIKAWDIDQYITLPHELRARIQAELVPNA